MKTNLTARNTTVRDNFKNSLNKKLSKLDRFFDDTAIANVTVSNESGRETVEITIKAHSMVFRSEKTSMDRLDSLDQVVDALFRQIVKSKKKLEKRFKKSAFEPDYGHEFVGTEEESYTIVKTKKFPVKPMDVEEAILQMNLVGHNFYMFRDYGGNICAVYKRKDGGYGLLEPEE